MFLYYCLKCYLYTPSYLVFKVLSISNNVEFFQKAICLSPKTSIVLFVLWFLLVFIVGYRNRPAWTGLPLCLLVRDDVLLLSPFPIITLYETLFLIQWLHYELISSTHKQSITAIDCQDMKLPTLHVLVIALMFFVIYSCLDIIINLPKPHCLDADTIYHY